MRCLHAIAAASLAVLLPSAPASADYTEIAPVRPLTMADPSGLTAVGIDIQYTRWTEHPPAPLADVDVQSITVNLNADIRLAPHWLLLARLPLSHATVDTTPDTDCCSLALGNLTLGGRGLWSTFYGDGSRAVSGGELTISLPSANDSGDRGASAANAAIAHLPHDPDLWAPNTTTIRLTGITQFWTRWFLAHAELGPQLYIYDSDVDDSTDLGLRLALAAGVRATYTVSILAELNALLFSDDKFRGGNDTTSSIDLGVRYGAGRGLFGLRIYLPLDPELRDVGMFGIGVDGGLRF